MPQLVHPIDRSRIAKYATSYRVRCAVSEAYSSKLNPRNLEVNYYPAYHHTLADLVDFEFEGAVIVGQQYNIWLSKATFDLYKLSADDLQAVSYYFVDDGEDNSAVEGEPDQEPAQEEAQDGKAMELHLDQDSIPSSSPVPSPPVPSSPVFAPQVSSSPPRDPISGRPQRSKKPPATRLEDFLTSHASRAALHPSQELTQEQHEDAMVNLETRARHAVNQSDATEADTSTNTIRTVPDGEAKENFPDMLLCHSYAVDVDRPDTPTAEFGWERRARCKVRHQCFPLIMEIKGCPSRTLRGERFLSKKRDLLKLAATELYDYVLAYFQRDVCAERVIAMVASGPYWQWVEVKRHEVARGEPSPAQRLLPEKDTTLQLALMAKLRKAPVFILATQASDEELTRLRDDALIPLIEGHHRYPATMAPNPPRVSKESKESEEPK